MINDQIYIASIYNAVERAKREGRLNLKTAQLFDLYRYYINFTDNIISTGNTVFNDWNILLKKEIAKLKYKNNNVICNYKPVILNNPAVRETDANIAPTVDDNSVNLQGNSTYTFKVGDFLNNFNDVNNDDYRYLIVYPTGLTEGSLSIFTTIFEIEGKPLTEELDLIYTRTNNAAFGPDDFTFRVSDNAVEYLYSSLQTMSVFADIVTDINLPPADIGDNTIYTTNRAITVLTLDMFTSDLQPPYNDPEGDLIDAIKIIDISNANQGVYKLNGVAILEEQIITREDINAGLFIHEGPDIDTVSSDTFQFQARDEGSGIWVD